MIYNFAILKNETEYDHLGWIQSCENSKYNVKYKVIDITKSDWLKNILKEDFDCFLARAPGSISYFKQLCDERLYVINNILKKKIYPTYEEILIYENKRMLAYWLAANNVPHAKTWIFYHKEEAIQFVKNCTFPLVAKTSIGAGGSGVIIFKKKEKVIQYIEKAFSDEGISRKWGPNFRKINLLKRLIKRLINIPETVKYFQKKHLCATIDPQRRFVIFQDYIKSDAEWRCVRIGDSFFAHKKNHTFGELMSGTSKVQWEKPSEELLNFVKNVTDKRNFLCQSIDLFEYRDGKLLVNEIQCFWGSRNPHQMIINGVPGRYLNKNGKWLFEKGTFNTNNSFDLRIEHVISLLNVGML